MFGLMRFVFYASRLRSAGKKVVKAKEAQDNSQLLLLLRKMIRLGHNALRIQSAWINEEARAYIEHLLVSAWDLYKQEAIAQMMEYDQELFASVAKLWQNKDRVPIEGLGLEGLSPIKQMMRTIEITRNRLDAGKELLRLVYDGEHVPMPLRKIMQAFIIGEVTREETEKRLDDMTAKLKHMDSILFPEEMFLR